MLEAVKHSADVYDTDRINLIVSVFPVCSVPSLDTVAIWKAVPKV